MPSEIEQRIQTVSLLLLSAVATAVALYWLKPLMIPFVLAVFVALGLAAAADAQVRYLRLPRAVAFATTLLLALLASGLVAGLIAASVGQLVDNAETYQARLTDLLQRISAALPLERLGLSPEDAAEPLAALPVGSIGTLLALTANTILDLLSRSFLVLIFVVYLLLGLGSRGAGGSGVWREIEVRVERYLAVKLAVSLATGVLVGSVLGALGVELALVFGLFAFLLNFIPSVGSVIATLLPLPVVIASPDIGPATAVLAIVLPGAVQVGIGNFLEPRIMGDSLDLHPLVILMALIFWGMLWGIAGMLLATPITAVLKILLGRLEITRPLSDLLGGRV
ncbi:MAG: AI-2E family transporter [Proteobacteria bacterium]|nr:AI-2E family transporter [Pseudomonadota bacterium]